MEPPASSRLYAPPINVIIVQSPLVTSSVDSVTSSELVMSAPHQHILPKPAPASSKPRRTASPLKPAKKLRSEDAEILRCKRRLDFAKRLGIENPCPAAVERRNERERKRVKQINRTFVDLRDHLPPSYWERKKADKVSKVDTLRAAIDYIGGLQQLIAEYDAASAVTSFSERLLNQVPDVDTASPPTPPPHSVLRVRVNSSNSSGVVHCSPGSTGSDPQLTSPPFTGTQSPPPHTELTNFTSWLLN